MITKKTKSGGFKKVEASQGRRDEGQVFSGKSFIAGSAVKR